MPAQSSVPSSAHRAPSPAARAEDRVSDRHQDGFDPDREGARPSPERAPDEVIVQDADAITENAAPRSGTNPFLLALWGLSALFIVGGIALLRAIPGLEQDLATGSNDGGGVSFYTIFSLASAAPVLIGLGLATATGTLFLHAARWRR